MFVYVGVLPQIERGEVKAERIDSAAQLLEPALGEDCRAGGGKLGQLVKVQPTFGRHISQPIPTAKFERFPFDLSHDVRMGSRR